jgi:ketosteroid isomerase-like protein
MHLPWSRVPGHRETWAASDANDFEAEHQIYREDAVLEYPQSGERIHGRRKIQLSRAAQPNRKTLHNTAGDRRGRPLGY